MLIVADENIPGLYEYFSSWGELRMYPGRQIGAGDVKDADVLLVRSVTKVNAALLSGSRVKFVGTCTVGRDHLDESWLRSQGIHIASAPGCNAQAVVEYVLAGLAYAALVHGFDWHQATLGIVGLGQVGSRLARAAMALGMKVVGCDPWLHQAEVPLLSLDELLQTAGVVSLHVPKVLDGPYPTQHLIRGAQLGELRADSLLINTSRGGVIDEASLLAYLRHAPQSLVVMDVWEGEPEINDELLSRVTLGTPHVAGYTQEGKWRGTAMVHEAMCEFYNVPLQSVVFSHPTLDLGSIQCPHAWEQAALRMVPIMRDDAALRSVEGQKARGFDTLRREYPPRFEFSAYRLSTTDVAVCAELNALGVMCT